MRSVKRLGEISAADGPAVTGRAAELEQALFDTHEALGRRTEELEAARQTQPRKLEAMAADAVRWCTDVAGQRRPRVLEGRTPLRKARR